MRSDTTPKNMELATVLLDIIGWVAAVLMVFGGVVPYIPQYLEIKRSKNAEGFSTYVCLTLLIANTLRIFFWFGHRFETPLLLQSIVMIFTMMLMVRLCTAVRAKTEIIQSKAKVLTDSSQSEKGEVSKPSSTDIDKAAMELKQRRFLDFDYRYFWRWTDFESYIEFMLLFNLAIGVVTYLFIGSYIFVETLGFLAVFFEALLGAPQFYKNLQNKSTKGMSLGMVLMWLSGDIFKTVYFVVRLAPAQFWLCGSLQVMLDIAIIGQVLYYGQGKSAVQ